MAWYEWILSLILFIISLGMLITIHEAGHFSMAKLFKVYCREFSIGFGPALLHKKKEGKETYFSIRAIPLGGYVSMFGEGAEELEEFKDIPVERSLESIKKWKKAIIVSAGIILNVVLSLILIGISNIAFPLSGLTTRAIIEPNSIAASAEFVSGDNIKFIYPDEYESESGGISPFQYEYTDDKKVIHAGDFFIVDPNVEMNENHYVLAFMFQGNKGNPSFHDGLKLYTAVSKESILGDCEFSHVQEMFKTWANEENSPQYYPNFEQTTYKIDDKTEIKTSISFIKSGTEEVYSKSIVLGAKDGKFVDIGFKFETRKIWLPFGERVKNTFKDFGQASVAVFKGLGVLFSGGIKNMSGVIGIFETSASLVSNYTIATYFYFWGLISVNLAIFNLLPFPGLDGWQLLVTAIEGISHKKIPMKFKSIMSAIGLGLIFILMIVIVVFDILRIVGI